MIKSNFKGYIAQSYSEKHLKRKYHWFKGTVMQTEKAQINDCFRVSKIS